MFALYVIAGIVGWAFVLLFIFSGSDAGELDSDFDMDLDADLDADFDLDTDADVGEGLGSGIAATALSFLSFRSILFFLAFFGLTGVLLDLLSGGFLLTLLAAVGVGLFAGSLNSRVFRYLKQSGTSSDIRDTHLQGSTAEVLLPISESSKGKIAVDLGGQRIQMVALPFHASRGNEFGIGETVVIVEIQHGTARVASMKSLEA